MGVLTPALLCWALLAAPADGSASGLFERYAERMVQVASIEKGAGTRSSYGTGFYVSGDGLIATNYHVVSQEVLEPGLHELEISTRDGRKLHGTVVDLDIVHDLAIVRADPPRAFFELHAVTAGQGLRLFSFGYPNDLELSVVEGTFNGGISKAMTEQYHFTGAINHGMSGGPVIDASGAVVGVNDASEGNSVGFLVPVAYLMPLVDRAKKGAAPDLLARARQQLLAYQQAFTELLLATPLPQRELGGHRVPGQWLAKLKCWGSDTPAKPRYLASSDYQCLDEEPIYVGHTQASGVLHYSNTWFDGHGLNRFHFANLAEKQFDGTYWTIQAGEKDVTPFHCRTDFVTVKETHLKVAFCARAYKRLAGLYDAVTQVASVDGEDSAVQSTFELAGFSLENATALSQRFVEGFSWAR